MKTSKIHWCDGTANPGMGCDGCELAPPSATVGHQLAETLAEVLPQVPPEELATQVRNAMGERRLSEVYRDRERIVTQLLQPYGAMISSNSRQMLIDVIRRAVKCYALLLGTMRAGHAGYADTFEEPKLFPGRMAVAAWWGVPSAAERAAKPWLAGLRRLNFVSDMGDALSRNVPFGFLNTEIVDNAISEKGRRHIWLWLSKRPERMAEFARWLGEQGTEWPGNLVAMTTVTSAKTLHRIDQLRQVPSPIRGLSVEPLFGPVQLTLDGIDWVIVGGGSDVLAEPFHVEWALSIHEQCQRAGVAFFLKQLGRNPFMGGRPVKLKDLHGGDWEEWPSELRIRQVPESFKEVAGVARLAAGAPAPTLV
jgi:protein gp37